MMSLCCAVKSGRTVFSIEHLKWLLQRCLVRHVAGNPARAANNVQSCLWGSRWILEAKSSCVVRLSPFGFGSPMFIAERFIDSENSWYLSEDWCLIWVMFLSWSQLGTVAFFLTLISDCDSLWVPETAKHSCCLSQTSGELEHLKLGFSEWQITYLDCFSFCPAFSAFGALAKCLHDLLSRSDGCDLFIAASSVVWNMCEELGGCYAAGWLVSRLIVGSLSGASRYATVRQSSWGNWGLIFCWALADAAVTLFCAACSWVCGCWKWR